MHNDRIEDFRTRLDTLAAGLVREVDQAHARGIGVSGGFTVLSSTRGVNDVNVPLDEAGLSFPPEPGDLYLTVSDENGDVRTHKISYDPRIQSLSDIATSISGIPNINAVVDAQNGQLKISSMPGYKFDFTGRMETTPDLTGFTGTSVPKFGGVYAGVENGEFEVRMVGSGTIGATADLKAEVYDQDGRLVAELDVGKGYEAGRALNIADGVSILFAAGDVVDGESFSTPLVANSDTGNLLSALGLNSFFVGESSTNIGVSNELIANPTRLAVSVSGEVSDASNLQRIIDLKDESIIDGQYGFEQFLGGISSEIGAAVRSSEGLYEQFQNIQFNYEADRDAVSGVDLNEEMINLTKYQRAYEASLRVITTIDQMFQDILQIL
ncbi:MAG: flagellar basal body rod C-terminal domain-containing protein [Pirellulaceae bacterium]